MSASAVRMRAYDELASRVRNYASYYEDLVRCGFRPAPEVVAMIRRAESALCATIAEMYDDHGGPYVR